MGTAGYLVFGEDTKGEIISNFSDAVAAPFKLLLVAHLILYIPIDFVVMRYSLLRLFSHTSEDELPLSIHCGVTIIMLAGKCVKFDLRFLLIFLH